MSLKNIIKFIKKNKVKCIVFLIILTLFLSISIPSFARYKNRTSISQVNTWDGNTSTSYHNGNGTSDNPYIISNGNELAYFASELQNTDYENTYFKLSNDIKLNDGIFSYDTTNGIQYIKDDSTYNIDPYSNTYMVNEEQRSINLFNSINNFKGYFDGNSFTIYGLYMTNNSINELGLFTNLQGNVSNLYVENALIYGGNITGGIASSANNANISNTLFSGYVVGNNTPATNTVNIDINDNIVNPDTTSLGLGQNNTQGEITSTSLTGNSSGDILINNITSNADFNIDLGSSILSEVPILSEAPVTINLTNLKYNITYKTNMSGGIIGSATNTTLTNTINKGYVYGYEVAGGLIGSGTNTNINQTYNKGSINSTNISGGLIGKLINSTSDLVISNSYNDTNITSTADNGLNGGLIGSIDNNTSLALNNDFNISDNYDLKSISNSTVTINNSYDVSGNYVGYNSGNLINNFVTKDISDLKNKSLIQDNLGYTEYIDSTDVLTNTSNVWVFEEDSLPILFIDDISKPVASIHALNNSWNNYSFDLNTIKSDSNITFSIEQEGDVKKYKKLYYYAVPSQTVPTPLSKTDLEKVKWHEPEYSSPVTLSDEGYYIIYVKIVDNNNNNIYLNSDILILDKTGANININLDSNNWNSLNNSLSNIYINENKDITVTADDALSGVSNIEYYVTSEFLDKTALDDLANDSWIKYTDKISLTSQGKYIVYVKVTDNCNYVTYANSDYINYNGYNVTSLMPGRNSSTNIDNLYVTDKSSIKYSINLTDTNTYNEATVHGLKSNILLPINSRIILIDKTNSQVYEYIVSTSDDNYGFSINNEANYPFTLFSKMGSNNILYTENYTGTINENYDVILDLSNTSLSTNYDNIELNLYLNNGDEKISTIKSSNKSFNVYSNVGEDTSSANLFINTDFTDTIEFNSDSTSDINITSGIDYKSIDSNQIYDTNYEDQKLGFAVKIVDSNNNVITKEHYKNMVFKIDDTEYYPDSDNIIRINLNNGIDNTSKLLNVLTYSDNIDLSVGTYYLQVIPYVSYDGIYYSNTSNNVLNIPINVSNSNLNVDYNFDVISSNPNKIIEKLGDGNIKFDVLQSGDLINPSIKVSLYKKDQLTAYNQDYSLVDLAAYTNNSLEQYMDKVYYVSSDPLVYDGTDSTYNVLNLNLKTDLFEQTGYKFVFELYDGNKRVSVIEQKFVVK